jgi:hypothetical protein
MERNVVQIEDKFFKLDRRIPFRLFIRDTVEDDFLLLANHRR